MTRPANAIDQKTIGQTYFNGTSFSAPTLTEHAQLLASSAGQIKSLSVATDGQLLIGSTGADPVLATLLSNDETVAIVNTAGGIDLSVLSVGSGLTFETDTIDAKSNAGVIKFSAAIGSGRYVRFLSPTLNGSEIFLTLSDDVTQCTYIGAGSGDASVGTDVQNIGVGTQTFQHITTGSQCVAIGAGSGSSLTTATGSSFIGFLSGSAFTSGDFNTGVGAYTLSNSGFPTLTGGYNCCFGAGSGGTFSSTESSNIVIGVNLGEVGDNNKIIIGVDGTGSGQQNFCQIAGIRSAAVDNQTLVAIDSSTGQLGATSLTSSDSSLTFDLTSPGTIDIVVADAGGYVKSILTDDGEALPIEGQITLTTENYEGKTVYFSGSGSGSNVVRFNICDRDNDNIYIGGDSGTASTGSDKYNTCLGFSTLSQVTSGKRSVAIGWAAGYNITDSNDGVYVGYLSGCSVFGGDFNTAIGQSTLYGGNNSVHLVGSYNTCLGYGSGSGFRDDESSNILICNAGAVDDNHKLLIGTHGTGSGQQNFCQIAGINGAEVSNQKIVCIDSTTGQLGATQITSSDSSVVIGLGTPGTIDLTVASGATGITWSEISTSIAGVQNSGYLVVAGSTITLPSSPSVGSGAITIVCATTDTVVVQAAGSKKITMGNISSSTNGSWSNSQPGDCMTLAYSETKSAWYAFADQGSWSSS